MTDGEVTSGELDRLDAAWDDLNLGRSNQSHAMDAADMAALRVLGAHGDVPPLDGRRIWSRVVVQVAEPQRQRQIRAVARGGRPMHLVAPSAPGWGWLPAGVIAVAASLAILAGILLGQNDGNSVTATFPGADASSVVATLPSSAPAWATPGSTATD